MSISIQPARLGLKEIARGTLVADGTEQLVVEVVNALTSITGYVDLQEMEDGDRVIIRQYIAIKPSGTQKRYAEETYLDAQANPLIYITQKEVKHGMMVTLEQAAGVLRGFDYAFYGVS